MRRVRRVRRLQADRYRIGELPLYGGSSFKGHDGGLQRMLSVTPAFPPLLTFWCTKAAEMFAWVRKYVCFYSVDDMCDERVWRMTR